MKTQNYILLLLIFVFSAHSLDAQSYIEMLGKENTSDFIQIKERMNEYWNSKYTIPKGKGFKQFKRWEWFWEQRTYPTGEIPDINYNINSGNNKYKQDDKQLNSAWSFVGPKESIGGFAGLGRVNVVKTSPDNENIIWAGAASGGLWKTTDGGSNWTTNTDNFASLGISDIAIQPNNSKIMYIATGDADAASTFSTGILKSTDSGENWKETGLKFKTSQLKRIYKLVMHPTNYNILYAVGSNGVDKTTNGGQNWVNVLQGQFFDFDMKPNDPNTIYAVGTEFFQSTTGGQFWEQITNGWPSINISRVAISVSPMAPNNVYAVFANSRNGFGGFAMSTNTGYTWQIRSNTPNILGWTPTGSDAGGQGWYDLCIAASPIDPNVVYVGGINIWRTDDAGLSWELETNWYSKNGVSTVHADHHDLWFIPNNTTLFSANDGGVYRKRFNDDWQWIGSGMGITQFYSLDCSQLDSSMILAGCQDNGTKLKLNDEFNDIRGGDGTTSRIDFSDDNIIYASIPFGGILLSTDKGKNFRTVKPIGSQGSWVTPFVLNQINPKSVYAGFQEVFKSTYMGINWSAISDFNLPEEQTLTFLAVSKSDTNVIYSGQGTGVLMKTTDGGANWLDFTRPEDLWITYLAVNPNNSEDICLTVSGYTDGKKVYRSYDGGQTWKNITKNLPNHPFNTLMFEENTPNRIYVGSDVGVYYIDDTKDEWIDYSDGLPNVVISELAVQKQSGLLRAATYGRGLWETKVAPTELSATITGDTNVCSGQTHLYITSSFQGVVNQWEVRGGNIIGQTDRDTVTVEWSDTEEGEIKLIQYLESGTNRDSTVKKIHISYLPSAEIQGPDSVCNNANMIYSSVNDAEEIRWEATGGEIIGSDSSKDVNVFWNSDSTSSLKLVLSTPNSECSDSIVRQINLRRVKKPVITGTQSACIGTEETYSSSFGNELIPFWSVVGGDIVSNSGSDIRVNWTNTVDTKVMLKLSNQNNGCTDSTHYDVIVRTTPNADIEGSNQVCIKTENIYNTSSDSSFRYKWSVENGYIIGPDSSDTVKVVWMNEGVNSLSLTKSLQSENCSSDTTIFVQCSSMNKPEVGGLSSVCMNQETDYFALSVDGLNLIWKVTGGEILSSDTDSIVTVQWNDYGIGYVKLIQNNTETGCIDSAVFPVQIERLPSSDFYGVTSACVNCIEEYTVKESGFVSKWSVTGGEILTSDEGDTISVRWTNPGTNLLKLVQTNINGTCSDSVVKEITTTIDTIQTIIGDTVCCINNDYIYSTSSSNDFSNSWVIDKGEIIGNQNSYSIKVKWTENGVGRISLTKKHKVSQSEQLFTKDVLINDRPPKPQISTQNFSLISSSNEGNQWYLNGGRIAGETDNIIYPAFEGKYQVSVSNLTDCESEWSDPVDFIFNSIDDDSDNDILIFPNPANREVFIKSRMDLDEITNVSIKNALGIDCSFMMQRISTNLIRLNMDCASGSYVIILSSKYKTHTEHFVITK